MEVNDGVVAAAGGRPPSVAVPSSQRYRKPTGEDSSVLVDVEGGRYPANVRGRNGPRVQVSFMRDGQTFTRWVDAVDVHAVTVHGVTVHPTA
ncbi:MAG: hypothetical protein H7323_13415 [Frankiales bacterium]|nr:hypothetical protein [Frankiales bacterium]